jgi:hypothetical protein
MHDLIYLFSQFGAAEHNSVFMLLSGFSASVFGFLLLIH